MIKFKALALVAAGLFAASTLFAHDQACCAGQSAGKMAKDGCSATFANLNLTPAQKAKMEKLGDDCMKGGGNDGEDGAERARRSDEEAVCRLENRLHGARRAQS